MSDKKKDAKSIRRGTGKTQKALRDHSRRARLNRQNPMTGESNRPGKKQGCLTLTAVMAISVGGAITGIVLGVKGLA